MYVDDHQLELTERKLEDSCHDSYLHDVLDVATLAEKD